MWKYYFIIHKTIGGSILFKPSQLLVYSFTYEPIFTSLCCFKLYLDGLIKLYKHTRRCRKICWLKGKHIIKEWYVIVHTQRYFDTIDQAKAVLKQSVGRRTVQVCHQDVLFSQPVLLAKSQLESFEIKQYLSMTQSNQLEWLLTRSRCWYQSKNIIFLWNNVIFHFLPSSVDNLSHLVRLKAGLYRCFSISSKSTII